MTKQPLIIFNRFRIREACDLKSMSITQLAGNLCTSTPNLYKMITNGFPRDRAEIVCKILGFSIAQLCDRLDVD